MRIRVLVSLALPLALACSASVGSSSDNAAKPADPAQQPSSPAPQPQPQPEPEPEPEPAGALAPALTLPDDVPPLDSACDTRRDFAVSRRDAALAFASNGCTDDAQCVEASTSTQCRGACPSAVLEVHAEAYESLRASLDERVCATYRDDGCAYATPRCMNGAPACVEGRCEWSGP